MINLIKNHQKTLLKDSPNQIHTGMFYLIPFVSLSLVLVLYSLSGLRPAVGYYLIHYLYNYSRGFVARGLLGEILSWFCDTVNDEITGITILIGSVLLIAGASLCIGKALSKAYKDNNNFKLVLFLCFILCIIPSSFRMYFEDIKLDKFLWAITLFAVFLADNKYLIWLCPALCIIATLINPVFLFCSMILISIILLQEFYSNNYSRKNGIICLTAYISMIVLGIYGVISEKQLGFNSPEELVDYYFSRYSGSSPIEMDAFSAEWLFDYFDDIITCFKKAYEIYFIGWENWRFCIVNFIFISLPVIILLSVFWKRVIKIEENKFQKFIFFLCAVSPVVTIPVILISWEAPKYFSNNIMVQLMLITYFIVKNNQSVITAVKSFGTYFNENKMTAAAVALYMAITII